MFSETTAWWLMAAVALGCAIRMVTARNPVHAALWLVGNFISLGTIFLILSAPMLFAIQLIVYAGAIMVLFLFVIMFFMSPKARQYLRPPLRSQQAIGGLLAVIFLSLLCVAMLQTGDEAAAIFDSSSHYDSDSGYAMGQKEEIADMGQPKALSIWMFQFQVLPFELTGLLLLAALLAAMMVARDEISEGHRHIEHFAPVLHPEDEFPTDEPDAEAGTQSPEGPAQSPEVAA